MNKINTNAMKPSLKLILIALTAFSLSTCAGSGQNANAVSEAGEPHKLMPLDKSRSLETEMNGEPVLQRQSLPLTGWQHTGIGRHEETAEGLVMMMPLETGQRARGSEDDPDYAIYGTCSVALPLGGQDFGQFNRLSFDIRTDLDAGIANMNVALQNDPASQLGAHLVNMQGQEWQHVIYQIDELPRNHDLKGRNLSKHDTVRYFIRNLQLEHVAQPESYQGWQTAAGHIAYSMSGYLTDGAKTAIVTPGSSAEFLLKDEQTGETVYQGRARLL